MEVRTCAHVPGIPECLLCPCASDTSHKPQATTACSPHTPRKDEMDYRDRIRCAVIVPEGASLLLVSYHFNAETFWSLPGGAPRSGESPSQTAIRELMEETGLAADDLRCVIVSDHTYRSGIGIDCGGPGGRYHELGICFMAGRHSGSLRLGDEPEHGNRHVIRSVRFIPLADLRSTLFYPSHLIEPILESARSGFTGPPVYIEDRSMRDWIAPVERAQPRLAAQEPGPAPE